MDKDKKEEMHAEAERLFQLGLLASRSAATAEGLQAVSRYWQDAIDFYRRAGEHKKAAEIEALLGRLASRMIGLPKLLEQANCEDEEDEGHILTIDNSLNCQLSRCDPRAVFRSPGRMGKDFKAWHTFFTVGCFGFGGPFAVWSLLQDEMVRRKKVLSNRDFLEAAVLGDILPGPVTMDIVTYTGYKLREWRGAALATMLFILPSFLLILVMAAYYDQYIGVPVVKKVFHALGAAVTGIIISVGLDLSRGQVKSYFEVGIFLWAFISSLIFKFDMLEVVTLAGFAGLLLEVVSPARERERERETRSLFLTRTRGEGRGTRDEG